MDANKSKASAINKLPQLSLKIVSDSSTADLYRAIRNHLPSLIPGLLPQDISTMSLGLSHSLSRHKLKFSPDKVDTMIVQAIALLDDLDKELNTYAMRVKEWYGWHFPEMGRIVNDNLAYARVILKMGMRSNASNADLADILPEEIEAAVKSAAEISMGTEITPEDMDNIQALAEQVASFTEYRSQLSTYLSNRMSAIAPNLTTLVGDLVGARLIAHAGSLMNLAKSPASTIQILGAEKALFRALKTKHDTPKYGLIYHASLIGQATGKNKGKVARILATKAALGLRVDALHEWGQDGEDAVPDNERNAVGLEGRIKVERRLASLEGRPLRSKGVAIGPNGVSAAPGKWEVKEARKYNPDADGLVGDEPAALAPRIKSSQESKKDDTLLKASQDSQKDEKLIEEIDEHAGSGDDDSSKAEAGAEDAATEDDVEMKDEPASQVEALAAKESINKANGRIEKAPGNGDEKSETISTVSDDTPDSPDSPTPQETNWQSSILGNTKVAKKARKKERHERKLAHSAERSEAKAKRNATLARRLDRKERRLKRAEQSERRETGEDEKYREPAAQAGLSIERYKRKLERGEIKFEDGKPVSISKKDLKKDLKKAKKAAEEAEKNEAEKVPEDGGKEKKRKRVDDTEGVEKSEKRKKKKSKA